MSRYKDLREELPLTHYIEYRECVERRDLREKVPRTTYPNESITHLYDGDIPVWELEGEFRDFTEYEKTVGLGCYLWS